MSPSILFPDSVCTLRTFPALCESSLMEVETVAFHSFDLPPPAFPRQSNRDFEVSADDDHLSQAELESTVAGAHSDREGFGKIACDDPATPSEIETTEIGGIGTAAVRVHQDYGELQATAVDASPFPAGLETSDLGEHPGRNVLESRAVDAPHSPAMIEAMALGAQLEGNPISESFDFKAATKLQKVYRSYRTRRRLADSAVVAEELWWQAIDFARLNHSTVSFFNFLKPETAISRWNRISLNASKVGQGLSKDSKALKLAFQHWIEAIDPRHRYGHNLHVYYDEWCESEAGQPFFYWLDIGDGRNVDLKECPRSKLQKQCIKYLGPQEREHYEYVPIAGKIVHKQTGELLDTIRESEGGKWIFVMSTSRRLYAGRKQKGMFHHSSFLAGGTTLAAGRFIVENGALKSIWRDSGHYRPNEEYLENLLAFLRENGVDLNRVEIHPSSNEDYYDDKKQEQEKVIEAMILPEPPQLEMPTTKVNGQQQKETTSASQTKENAQVEDAKGRYNRTLSGGLQSPRGEVSEKAILERIKSKSKRDSSSYQLGNQLSLKWCTGAGPRIGCVADYPVELRMQALEFVNLSPRDSTPRQLRILPSCLSPTTNAADGKN